MSVTNTKELIEELRVQANQHPGDVDLIQFDFAATALEQLEARCAELERERVEVARCGFIAGANWQAGGLAFNQPVINREANQYIEREYGTKEQQ